MAIRSFRNFATRDIAMGQDTRVARQLLPTELHTGAREKLLLLDAAGRLGDLSLWPSLRLERLKGNRKGQYSIRINSKYRICFDWSDGEACSVEIVDYH